MFFTINECQIFNGTIYDRISAPVCVNNVKCILQEMYGALTVVADGCFSKLRKGLVKLRPEVKSHFVGLLLDNCPQIRANHAELVLAEPSPVLVYQISSTKTRVLVDMRDGMPRDIRSHLLDHIAPQMPGTVYPTLNSYSCVCVCVCDSGVMQISQYCSFNT